MMDYYKMAEKLNDLNPDYVFVVEDDWDHDEVMPMFIETSAPVEEFKNLVLPEGYVYNKKNSINNKHKHLNGSYETYMLAFYNGSEYFYDE